MMRATSAHGFGDEERAVRAACALEWRAGVVKSRREWVVVCVDSPVFDDVRVVDEMRRHPYDEWDAVYARLVARSPPTAHFTTRGLVAKEEGKRTVARGVPFWRTYYGAPALSNKQLIKEHFAARESWSLERTGAREESSAYARRVGALTAAIAENKRIPFDLPEAESELVAGYYTEYSAMKMGLFMFAEFIQIAIVGALFTTLFLGGYNLPFMSDAGFLFPGGHTVALSHGLVVPLQMLGFLAKVFLMCVIQIQIRWSLPRFRYDQMLSFAWKMLLPLSLANLVVTAVAMWLLEGGQ